jgi:hypothetical protein
MDKLSPELRDQLLGEMIVMWQCPRCEQVAFTHRDQQALMVKCSGDHGNTLVWMEEVPATPPRPEGEGE